MLSALLLCLCVPSVLGITCRLYSGVTERKLGPGVDPELRKIPDYLEDRDEIVLPCDDEYDRPTKYCHR